MLSLLEMIEFDDKALNLLSKINTKLHKKKDQYCEFNIYTLNVDNDNYIVELNNTDYGLNLYYSTNGWRRVGYIIKSNRKEDAFKGLQPFVNTLGIYCTNPEYDYIIDETNHPFMEYKIFTSEEMKHMESTAFQKSTVMSLNSVRAVALQSKLIYDARDEQYVVGTDMPELLMNQNVLDALEKTLQELK